METTVFRARKRTRGVKGKDRRLSDQELYDLVIVLIEYNKVNPRKRWSELCEKIMTMLEMTVVYDQEGQEVLYFDDEDQTFV